MALYCASMHWGALNCTQMHCTTLYFSCLQCTAVHCSALQCTSVLYSSIVFVSSLASITQSYVAPGIASDLEGETLFWNRWCWKCWWSSQNWNVRFSFFTRPLKTPCERPLFALLMYVIKICHNKYYLFENLKSGEYSQTHHNHPDILRAPVGAPIIHLIKRIPHTGDTNSLDRCG